MNKLYSRIKRFSEIICDKEVLIAAGIPILIVTLVTVSALIFGCQQKQSLIENNIKTGLNQAMLEEIKNVDEK